MRSNGTWDQSVLAAGTDEDLKTVVEVKEIHNQCFDETKQLNAASVRSTKQSSTKYDRQYDVLVLWTVFDVERVDDQGATRNLAPISAKTEVTHLISIDQ